MTQLTNSVSSVKGGKIWEKPQLVRPSGFKQTIFISIVGLGLTLTITGILLSSYWVPTLFSQKIENSKTFLFTQPNFNYIFWMLVLVMGGMVISLLALPQCFPFVKSFIQSTFILIPVVTIFLCIPNLAAPLNAQNDAFTTWLSHDNGLRTLPTSPNKSQAQSNSSLTVGTVANHKTYELVNNKNEIVNVTFTVTSNKIQIKNITPASIPNLG